MIEKNLVRLVAPTPDLYNDLTAAAREYVNAARQSSRPEESRYEALLRLDRVGFGRFCEELAEQSRGIGVPSDWVPSTTYWLVRGEGDQTRFIASARLRHSLNLGLLNEGGNIGYDVRPSERRKGYGTLLLSFVLDKSREIGLSRVLITCDDDNVGSARIIEKNGGKFQDLTTSHYTGKPVRRYWIEL